MGFTAPPSPPRLFDEAQRGESVTGEFPEPLVSWVESELDAMNAELELRLQSGRAESHSRSPSGSMRWMVMCTGDRGPMRSLGGSPRLARRVVDE